MDITWRGGGSKSETTKVRMGVSLGVETLGQELGADKTNFHHFKFSPKFPLVPHA